MTRSIRTRRISSRGERRSRRREPPLQGAPRNRHLPDHVVDRDALAGTFANRTATAAARSGVGDGQHVGRLPRHDSQRRNQRPFLAAATGPASSGATGQPPRSRPANGFKATLDSGGSHRSQSISSLSTPITATSSGTAIPYSPQTFSTWWPRSSVAAIRPTGFGSDLQPRRHMRRPAADSPPPIAEASHRRAAAGPAVNADRMSPLGQVLREILATASRCKTSPQIRKTR